LTGGDAAPLLDRHSEDPDPGRMMRCMWLPPLLRHQHPRPATGHQHGTDQQVSLRHQLLDQAAAARQAHPPPARGSR